MKKIQFLLITCFALLLSMAFVQQTDEPKKDQMVRFAKIKVDPKQLEAYTIALKKQMHAAIELEPGVLSYYAVADKKDPSSITILEVYANEEAYKKHTSAPHFLEYKETVKNMVIGLELQDVTTVAAAKKKGM